MGTLLKRFRQRAGYATATEFADAIGMNINTYRKYEQGSTRITLDFAVELADRFGVTLDDLAGRSGVSDVHVMHDDPVEERILRSYRNASEDGRAAIIAVAASQEKQSASAKRRMQGVPIDLGAAEAFLDSMKPTADEMPEGITREQYLTTVSVLQTLGLSCLQVQDDHHIILPIER